MPRKRKRDQDGLFARPDSPFWWASYTDGGGRPTRRSTGIRREQDPSQIKARALRAQWVLEAETQRCDGPPPEAQGRTFDDLMLLYLSQVSPSKKSGERDKYSAKQLYRVFTGQSLQQLSGADARAYIAQRLKQGATPGTVNKEIGLFSAALNWARQELAWKVPNPLQSRRLREPAGRDRWLSQHEAAALIAAAQQSVQAPHLADFIRLGLHTGMRPGEMLGLEWERVDLPAGLLYLQAHHQKNGKTGSVPLNQEASTVIWTRAQFRTQYCPASPWVFSERQGVRIASIKKGFKAAVERAGLQDVHPHDLRRTFGSWLVQRGVDIRRVSELMRHSDIRVTAQVYAHLAPGDLMDAVNVLDTPEPRYEVSRSGFTLAETPSEETIKLVLTG